MFVIDVVFSKFSAVSFVANIYRTLIMLYSKNSACISSFNSHNNVRR